MKTKQGRKVFPVKGMSLRDYFAAQALPAIYNLYAGELKNGRLQRFQHNAVAEGAYGLADCMLAAREEEGAS